jgi:hypothetical protein
MPGASYNTVTSDARPGRILLAEQQVLSDRSAGSSTDTSATSCRTRSRVGSQRLAGRRGVSRRALWTVVQVSNCPPPNRTCALSRHPALQ